MSQTEIYEPQRNLRIAIAGIDIKHGDKDANLTAATRAIEAIGRAADEVRLVVLPEMFSTGFLTDADEVAALAEPTEGPTLAAVARLSREAQMAICGSIIAVEDGRYFNRGFVVMPSGERIIYDKRHLFSPGEEGRVFTPGRGECPVFEIDSWRLKLAICYDLRFPVWNRNVGLEYDALIFTANWPEAREYAWRQLLIARAIENQAYVVGANRTGEDRSGIYPAAMMGIYDYMGKPIAEQEIGVEDATIVIAELDAKMMAKFRRRFAVWADADQFTIEGLE